MAFDHCIVPETAGVTENAGRTDAVSIGFENAITNGDVTITVVSLLTGLVNRTVGLAWATRDLSTNVVAPGPECHQDGICSISGCFEPHRVDTGGEILKHVVTVVELITGHHAIDGEQTHPGQIDRLRCGHVALYSRNDPRVYQPGLRSTA